MLKIQVKNKNEKGITLIALVITIIILLILATISIQSITQTGLFEATNKAKLEDKRGKIAEYLKLKLYEEQTKKYDKTEEEIVKATRENVVTNKKELLEYGKDVNIKEIQKEQKEGKTNTFFNVIVDGDVYKVELSGVKFTENKSEDTPNITLELSETSGTVVDGASKTVNIIGSNYGTLNVTSNNPNVATASVSENKLTVTGTIVSGTNTATITVAGSQGGSATYTVTAHRHTGNSSSGGGCYGVKNQEKVSCGGKIEAKQVTSGYYCDGTCNSPLTCYGTCWYSSSSYNASTNQTTATYVCNVCGNTITQIFNYNGYHTGGYGCSRVVKYLCNKCGDSGSYGSKCGKYITNTSTTYVCNTCGKTYSSTGTCTAMTRDEVYYSKKCGY